jgi:hypothetical protein
MRRFPGTRMVNGTITTADGDEIDDEHVLIWRRTGAVYRPEALMIPDYSSGSDEDVDEE